MLSMFESLAKAALAVVTLPVAVVADAVTLGGSLNERGEPYTASAARDLMVNLHNAAKPGDRRG